MGDRTLRAVFGLGLLALFGLGATGCPPPPPPECNAGAVSLSPIVASSLGRLAAVVVIGTSQNGQAVVNAHPAGTCYELAAGTHQTNFAVVPKTGDIFYGANAVLDGGNSLAHAFSGGAANVVLDGFTVQNYATGYQGAAIQPTTAAGGWIVRNVTSQNNYWAGIMATNNMQILGGHYNSNGQLGISGNSATGILVDGAEMAYNQVLRETCEFEGGGFKWDIGSVTVRNSNIHHNDCRGLWSDQNGHDMLLENNIVNANAAEGIAIEISQDAVIRNNSIYGNGNNAPGGNGWYWNGGITIMASFNTEIYGNHLSGNYNGITGVQQDRFDDTPPAHLLDHMHVHDNLICATVYQHPTGVIADNGANLAIRDITFTNNTIQTGPCF